MTSIAQSTCAGAFSRQLEIWYGRTFYVNGSTGRCIVKKSMSLPIIPEYDAHVNQFDVLGNSSGGSENACVAICNVESHAKRSEQLKRLINCDGRGELIQSVVALLRRVPGNVSCTDTKLHLCERLTFEKNTTTCVQLQLYVHNIISIGEIFQAHVIKIGSLSTTYSVSDSEKRNLTCFVDPAVLGWDEKESMGSSRSYMASK